MAGQRDSLSFARKLIYAIMTLKMTKEAGRRLTSGLGLKGRIRKV